MLFTDRFPLLDSQIYDFDPDVLEAERSEGLRLQPIIDSTMSLCSTEIKDAVSKFGAFENGVPIAHLQAVYNGSTLQAPWYAGTDVSLHRIVTSPIGRMLSPIALWLVRRFMVDFWNQARYRSSANNLYEKKLQLSESARDAAWDAVLRDGLRLVFTPLSCPGAEYENVGRWDINALSLSPGGSQGEVAGVVAITWAGVAYAGPTAKGNAESGISRPIPFIVEPNNRLRVDITGLSAPADATKWNVYFGNSPDAMVLQQHSIPLATKVVTLGDIDLSSRPDTMIGQEGDRVLRFSRRMAW